MIEGTDFYDYFSCPYKVYNRHNRDRKLMIPPSEFSKQLMKTGIQHEEEIIKIMHAIKPDFPKFDFDKGFEETNKLMKQGIDVIYHGVLKYGDYLGIPDILIKEKGKSRFGNHIYVAGDIKSSIKSKESQIMQLKLYDYILEKVQGKSSGKGMLILKTTSEIIELDKYKDKFNAALEKIKEIIKGKEFGLHLDSICKECPWKEVCFKIAKEKEDLSLVYGLPRPVHYKLNELKIFTLHDLQNTSNNVLEKIEGVGHISVNKWKQQTEVLLSKKEKITKYNPPETKNHICLDIETSEDGKTYLIGLWHNNKFVAFFSEDEKKNINDLIQYLDAFKDYRLYHYGNIEKVTFKQLFEKYSIPQEKANEILEKMIDLFVVVKKHMILPITYYGLKDVAKYLGFKWRASDASGSNSMSWYDKWVETKDEAIKQKIMDYNEDDVHATFIILEKVSK